MGKQTIRYASHNPVVAVLNFCPECGVEISNTKRYCDECCPSSVNNYSPVWNVLAVQLDALMTRMNVETKGRK